MVARLADRTEQCVLGRETAGEGQAAPTALEGGQALL